MYLVWFLVNFVVFCLFLWILQDFADLLEICSSTTAQNIRRPDRINNLLILSAQSLLENPTPWPCCILLLGQYHMVLVWNVSVKTSLVVNKELELHCTSWLCMYNTNLHVIDTQTLSNQWLFLYGLACQREKSSLLLHDKTKPCGSLSFFLNLSFTLCCFKFLSHQINYCGSRNINTHSKDN